MIRAGNQLTVHMMVRNEEFWIWFALAAALDGCDRLMLWDTGSEDRTLDIAQSVADDRLHVERVAVSKSQRLCEVRNDMLDATETDFFAIVDGDEVWPPSLWRQVEAHTRDPRCDAVVVPACYPFPWLGAFHTEGKDDHEIADVTGPYAARVFRRAPGLRWRGEFGEDGLFSAGGTELTRGSHNWMRVVSEPFWHMTLLPRSPLDDSTFWRQGKVQVDDADAVVVDQITRDQLPGIFTSSLPAAVMDPFAHVHPSFWRTR